MSVNDQYALNWSNHTNHIRKAFDSLLAGSEFVDVTLSCEGKKVSAHKMLLSACSTYFHDLFRDNPCQHPIVILKDVKFQNLVDILKFMYNGEVSVATENFDSFLKTAELLQVSGLTDDEARYNNGDREDETGAETSQTTLIETPGQAILQPAVKKSVAESPKEKEVTKKRLLETNIVEESTSQKRKKSKELETNIEIKQEADVISLDEDNVEIKDPLELDEQNESLEGMDMLQPVAYAQQHKLTQTKKRSAANRKMRRNCYNCTIRNKQLLRYGGSSKIFTTIKKVSTYCGACPSKPFLCVECFNSFHI